jgi:hypothetical protein
VHTPEFPLHDPVQPVRTPEILPRTPARRVRGPEFPLHALARPVHGPEFLPHDPVWRVRTLEILLRAPEFPVHATAVRTGSGYIAPEGRISW